MFIRKPLKSSVYQKDSAKRYPKNVTLGTIFDYLIYFYERQSQVHNFFAVNGDPSVELALT